ncbi:MAG: peptidase D-alanyl-D-alanine carboxypeptidase 1 [Frankiales bacterium]|nr:peptidase D-alanyl-D-alanine carboxypeptidase 1 [Frankiales bacterium]
MRRPLSRLSSAAVAAVVTLGTLAGPASPAHADLPATGTTIGGDRLAATTTIVQRGAGAKKLPSVSASSYVLADLDTGAVLAARDAHGKYLPASTLKVLTYLAVQPVVTPEMTITATFEDESVDGSRVGIQNHKVYTADDLYRAMLMVSGNDAALALTHPVGGPKPAVTLMNAEAKRLQALDTTAKTVNGLDANGQATSAYDLALFGKAALKIPAFATYVTTKSSYFPLTGRGRFQIYTHDHLLLNYKGALGIKNGYTVAAGGTFIGAAERNGHRLVVALLHARPDVWREAGALLDWGFANASLVTPVGTLVDPVPPPAAAVDPSAPAAQPSAPASAGPGTPGVTTAAAAPAQGSSNGLVALVGGIGGGVLLAGVAALWASRRRRDRFPSFTDDDAVDGLPHTRAGGVEIVVPPTPQPTFTSNIRVYRSDE